MEHATRRILYANVTAHPTASWTLQQLREAIPADHTYRFLIHDRDSIFSQQFDQGIASWGCGCQDAGTDSASQCPLRAAYRHAAAGMPGFCDPIDRQPPADVFMLAWIPHYNAGRPHMSGRVPVGCGQIPRTCASPLQGVLQQQVMSPLSRVPEPVTALFTCQRAYLPRLACSSSLLITTPAELEATVARDRAAPLQRPDGRSDPAAIAGVHGRHRLAEPVS